MAGKQFFRNIALGLIATASLCFAQGEDSAASNQPTADQGTVKNPTVATAAEPAAVSPIKNNTSIFFALDEGQVMKGIDNSGNLWTPVSRVWQQKMFFHLTNDMTYMERTRFILSMECALTFSFLQLNAYPATLTPLFTFYPNDVEIAYTLGDLEKPWMTIAAGYFPFKYNPDAKHLGEYLLRSSAYPTFIETSFEFPMTRELGFHFSGSSDWIINPAIDRVKWDLMLTSETHDWPTQDWTLTFIASNNLFNFVELGGGVSFQRLLSVNEAKTTPHDRPNSRYLDENGDTSFYSFKSTKLMGRASIYPQRFIPEFRIPFAPLFGDKPFFGKEDLKIYGEEAVLGLTDYVAYVDSGVNGQKRIVKAPEVPVNFVGQYYDSVADRMPYMIGVNLPTNPILAYGIEAVALGKWLDDETGSSLMTMKFSDQLKIPLAALAIPIGLAGGAMQHYWGWDISMDEISLEFEEESQRFPNSDKFAIDFTSGNTPLPTDNSKRLQYVPNPMTVKYALHFKKSFMDQRVSISGLVARDHMRPAFHGPGNMGVCDDFLQAKQDWWWTLRLSANF